MKDGVSLDSADALAAQPGLTAVAQPGVSLADTTLAGLFNQAREAIRERGALHETPRGATHSLNGVMLTWVSPERDTTPPPRWSRAEIAEYLDIFVSGRPENDPARPAKPGVLVFPYTYAARARYWDGGWGYLAALRVAMRATGWTVSSIATSREAFEGFLAEMGERLHLQTVLALCALYPPAELHRWLDDPERLSALRRAWQRDLLADAIADIAKQPASRRAIVSALSYPQLEDQLRPRMGLPPYQLFQFLPGEAGTPLSSIHVHRSLDLESGAVLDFAHDLAWLREASARTGRRVGDITVVAHNLHAYVGREESASPREGIRGWLCRVTDGYETGRGAPRALLAQPACHANVEWIWSRWQA